MSSHRSVLNMRGVWLAAVTIYFYLTLSQLPASGHDFHKKWKVACQICNGNYVCGTQGPHMMQCENGLPCTKKQHLTCEHFISKREICDGPGVFSHPTSSKNYVKCVLNHTNKISKKIVKCPKKTKFSTSALRCLTKREFDMLKRLGEPKQRSEGDNSFQCPRAGVFADPLDCKKYYECNTQLKATGYYCEAKKYFDRGKCVKNVTKECRKKLTLRARDQFLRANKIYNKISELLKQEAEDKTYLRNLPSKEENLILRRGPSNPLDVDLDLFTKQLLNHKSVNQDPLSINLEEMSSVVTELPPESVKKIVQKIIDRESIDANELKIKVGNQTLQMSDEVPLRLQSLQSGKSRKVKAVVKIKMHCKCDPCKTCKPCPSTNIDDKLPLQNYNNAYPTDTFQTSKSRPFNENAWQPSTLGSETLISKTTLNPEISKSNKEYEIGPTTWKPEIADTELSQETDSLTWQTTDVKETIEESDVPSEPTTATTSKIKITQPTPERSRENVTATWETPVDVTITAEKSYKPPKQPEISTEAVAGYTKPIFPKSTSEPDDTGENEDVTSQPKEPTEQPDISTKDSKASTTSFASDPTLDPSNTGENENVTLEPEAPPEITAGYAKPITTKLTLELGSTSENVTSQPEVPKNHTTMPTKPSLMHSTSKADSTSGSTKDTSSKDKPSKQPKISIEATTISGKLESTQSTLQSDSTNGSNNITSEKTTNQIVTSTEVIPVINYSSITQPESESETNTETWDPENLTTESGADTEVTTKYIWSNITQPTLEPKIQSESNTEATTPSKKSTVTPPKLKSDSASLNNNSVTKLENSTMQPDIPTETTLGYSRPTITTFTSELGSTNSNENVSSETEKPTEQWEIPTEDARGSTKSIGRPTTHKKDTTGSLRPIGTQPPDVPDGTSENGNVGLEPENPKENSVSTKPITMQPTSEQGNTNGYNDDLTSEPPQQPEITTEAIIISKKRNITQPTLQPESESESNTEMWEPENFTPESGSDNDVTSESMRLKIAQPTLEPETQSESNTLTSERESMTIFLESESVMSEEQFERLKNVEKVTTLKPSGLREPTKVSSLTTGLLFIPEKTRHVVEESTETGESETIESTEKIVKLWEFIEESENTTEYTPETVKPESTTSAKQFKTPNEVSSVTSKHAQTKLTLKPESPSDANSEARGFENGETKMEPELPNKVWTLDVTMSEEQPEIMTPSGNPGSTNKGVIPYITETVQASKQPETPDNTDSWKSKSTGQPTIPSGNNNYLYFIRFPETTGIINFKPKELIEPFGVSKVLGQPVIDQTLEVEPNKAYYFSEITTDNEAPVPCNVSKPLESSEIIGGTSESKPTIPRYRIPNKPMIFSIPTKPISRPMPPPHACFKCPHAGYFRDPNDCHYFYHCKAVENLRFNKKPCRRFLLPYRLVATRYKCKNDLWFSDLFWKCVMYKPARC